jgi:hypothetical protein
MKRLWLLLILSISFQTYATTYYVSTSGNNASNGLSTTTPWQTLQYAEAHAIVAGDIVALKKGDVWTSLTALAIKHGGVTWNGSLWGTGGNAIIRSSGSRSDGNEAIINIIACQNITFKNIIVDGNNNKAYGLVIGGHGGYSNNVQNNENHIIIDGCSVLNCGDGTDYRIGFLCQTWTTDISDITVKNCIFDGADDEQLSFYGSKSSDGGTPRECKNVYIGYNTLTNWGRRNQSTGYGLQINNKITNVIIEYNTLSTGAKGHGNGIHIESNETVTGYFPTIIVIRNNKVNITESNRFCLYITQGQAKTVDVSYNIFNQGNTTNDTDGGGVWITTDNWTGAKLTFTSNYIKSLSGRTVQNDCNNKGVVVLTSNTLINSGTANFTSFCLITSPGLSHASNTYIRTVNTDYTKVKQGSTYYQTQAQVLSWEPTAKFTEVVIVPPPVPVVNDTIYIKVIGKTVISYTK